jgi:hypothetical protein
MKGRKLPPPTQWRGKQLTENDLALLYALLGHLDCGYGRGECDQLVQWLVDPQQEYEAFALACDRHKSMGA